MARLASQRDQLLHLGSGDSVVDVGTGVGGLDEAGLQEAESVSQDLASVPRVVCPCCVVISTDPRGGGWIGDASFCSSANHYSGRPSYRNSDFGFRVALRSVREAKPAAVEALSTTEK